MSASEPGIVSSSSSRGSLGIHNPQPPPQQQPPPAATAQPVIQTMQLSFGADGNAVYKPVSGNSTSPFSVISVGNGNGAAAVGEGINVNMGMGVGGGGGGSGEQSRKKRGRPRKYAPDGSMAVPPLNAVPPAVVSMNNPSSGGFPSPQPPQNHHHQQQQQQLQSQNHHQANMQNHHQQQPQKHHQQQLQNNHIHYQQQQQQQQNHIQQLQIQGLVQGVGAPESPVKKRGRPPGSANKKQHQNHHNRQQQQQQQQQEDQQFDALGSPGIGFTPHVITVNTGEDVSSKIMSFSQHGPRAICILSANGTISSVTLRQAATSGGSVTYEGRFEILSLSGSFMLSENGGGRSRSGGLSVSLAGPDGRVLGGGVAGLLTAASPVQVVVGSFIADGRKELKTPSPTEPLFPPSRLHSVTGPQGPSSPPSNGTLSGSSGGPGSPPNLGAAAVNSAPPPNLSNLPWK